MAGRFNKELWWPANSYSVICPFVLQQMRVVTAVSHRLKVSREHHSPLEDQQDLHCESSEPPGDVQSYHLWSPNGQQHNTKQVCGVVFGGNQLVGDSEGPAERSRGKPWSFGIQRKKKSVVTARAVVMLSGKALHHVASNGTACLIKWLFSQ